MRDKTRLDAIDRHILRALHDDGRIRNIDLAARVNITPPPCLRRAQALERDGYIRGYHAELDAPRLGFGATGFVAVILANQTRDALAAFEAGTLEIPAVRDCVALSGEIDFILKCVAKDEAAFHALVSGTIARLPGVKEARSHPVGRRMVKYGDIPSD
ncbi:MAG: Lrp/AsnC family transcriptional regulator [Proteobacteria bacterium]|nr:Lrp/AsnC family transcriptional regulator [Pseudomonadota bacterium]